MPTRNVNLTTHFDNFVETSIASGRYQNASEVIREGLRLLERREQEDALRLERLRSAIQAGEDDLARGDYYDLTSSELDDYLARLGNTVDQHERTTSR